MKRQSEAKPISADDNRLFFRRLARWQAPKPRCQSGGGQMLRVAVMISSGKPGIIAADLAVGSEGSVRVTDEVEQYAKKSRTK